MTINKLPNILVCCLVTLCAGQWAYSQTPATAPAQRATGEDINRIMVDRPAVPVTHSVGQRKAKPPKAPLPVEGAAVLNARCTIQKDADSDWQVLNFQAADAPYGQTQLWVQPCDYLSQMEKQATDKPGTHFKVSGQITTFEGRAFLVLNKVLVEPPKSSNSLDDVAPATQPSAESQPLQNSAAVAATPKESSDDDAGTSPAAIAHIILEQKPYQYVPPAAEHTPDLPKPASIAPSNAAELTPETDGMVINRVVRVIEQPSTGWWTVRFVDNTLQDPPLRLLPCELLSKLQLKVAGPPAPVVPKRRKVPDPLPANMQFRVTGVVKQYKEHRYLLLEKCVLERDMDQF